MSCRGENIPAHLTALLKDLPEGTALYRQQLEELLATDAKFRKVEATYGEAYTALRSLEERMVTQQEQWLGGK